MANNYFGRLCRYGAPLALGLSLQATTLLAFEAQLTGPADEDLRDLLEGGSLLLEQSEAEEVPDVREIVSTAQADYKRLLAVLYQEGYFGPDIQIKLDGREAASILAVSPPPSVRQAVITVDPGKKFSFGKVAVDPLPQDAVLPEGFASGETAQLSVIQSAARSGVRAWRSAGYAKADIAGQQITARHAAAEIDALLTLEPGPRLRFGALQVEDASAVREERILEIAGLPEGEVFSPKELDDAASRLRRTGAFRSVAMIEGDVTPGDDTLPVQVRVADNKPRRFGFGAEIETTEGLSLSAFWLHRNLLGGAESLRVDAEIGGLGGDVGGTSGGGEDYLLRTRFQRPATFGPDTGLYLLGEIEQEDEPNYFSRTVTLEGGIERIVNDNISYTLGTGLRGAQTEDFFGDQDYTLWVLPGTATFDYRDNELNALKGFYAKPELMPFIAIDGTDSGLLAELDFRTYYSFGGDRPTTLALRAQLGSVIGPSIETAPTDFLFYSGGGGTVRGQDYQSLGVQVGPDEDDIIGGRSFLGLSAEVRFRSEGSLGYVGFFDAGYIGTEAFPDSSGEWHSGAGLGIRYATPIGPLRVDVAAPVSGDTDGEDFYFYFGIGHSF